MAKIKCFDSQGLWMFQCGCGKECLLKVDYINKNVEIIK